MPEAVRTKSHRETVAELGRAQKSRAPGSPAYSLLVNRPAGRHLAAWAARQGLVPDQVTMISGGLTFSGIIAIALAPAYPWWGLIVWVLLAAGYAFDAADGQLARLRGGGSPAGEWLDHVVDSAKLSSLHLAVAVWLYAWLEGESAAWLLVPVGFAVVAAVAFFTQVLNDLLRRLHPGHGTRTAMPSLRRSILVLPTDYGVLCLAFVLLGFPTAFLSAYVLLAAASLAHLALALRAWRRDMLALSRDITSKPELIQSDVRNERSSLTWSATPDHRENP